MSTRYALCTLGISREVVVDRIDFAPEFVELLKASAQHISAERIIKCRRVNCEMVCAVRKASCVLALSEHELVFLGGSKGQPRSVHVLNLETCNWETFPSLQHNRYGAVGIGVPEGNICVLGGKASDEAVYSVKSVEVYDSRKKNWRAVQPMPEERKSFQLVCNGSHVYVLSCANKTFMRIDLSSCFSNEPHSECRWSDLSEWKHFRPEFSKVVVAQNYLVVIGGLANCAPVNKVDVYDIRRNAWMKGPALRDCRRNPHLFLLDNEEMLVVLGGLREKLEHSMESGEFIRIDDLIQHAISPSKRPAEWKYFTTSGIGNILKPNSVTIDMWTVKRNQPLAQEQKSNVVSLDLSTASTASSPSLNENVCTRVKEIEQINHTKTKQQSSATEGNSKTMKKSEMTGFPSLMMTTQTKTIDHSPSRKRAAIPPVGRCRRSAAVQAKCDRYESAVASSIAARSASPHRRRSSNTELDGSQIRRGSVREKKKMYESLTYKNNTDGVEIRKPSSRSRIIVDRAIPRSTLTAAHHSTSMNSPSLVSARLDIWTSEKVKDLILEPCGEKPNFKLQYSSSLSTEASPIVRCLTSSTTSPDNTVSRPTTAETLPPQPRNLDNAATLRVGKVEFYTPISTPRDVVNQKEDVIRQHPECMLRHAHVQSEWTISSRVYYECPKCNFNLIPRLKPTDQVEQQENHQIDNPCDNDNDIAMSCIPCKSLDRPLSYLFTS